MQRYRSISGGVFLIGVIFLAFGIPYLVVFAEPSAKWIRTFDGIGDDEAYSVQVDDIGYVLTGITNSSGFGQYDAWLIKTDSSGDIKWNRTYGGLLNDRVDSLVTTGDGGYVLAGSTTSFGAGSTDVWLVKVDSFGNLEWNQTYGGSIADYCDSMVVSSDGGYTLACISQTPTFGDGVFWLVKVDSVGNLEWNQTLWSFCAS